MKPLKNIGVISLGCPRNLVDSEHILGRLDHKGYRIVDMQDADIAIVNTCGFIEDAKKESLDVILDVIELKKTGRLKKIVVYGCLAERYSAILQKEFPEVDAFIGKVSLNHAQHSFSLTPSHYAYLKICEGCINACSFCIIPKIKGAFTSVPKESLKNRVAALDEKGIRELILIGQDISGYGVDLYKHYALSKLLKLLLKSAPHIDWFRLLYLYPDRIDQELVSLIAGEPRICKYIDLPLQHCNDRILTMMRRGMKNKQIRARIASIRKKIPGVCLRTSLIVGFPSETDKEFKELLAFIKEMRFERLGVFMYSQEEGTEAYHFKQQVPQAVKQARFDEIMSLQQTIARSINERFQGTILDVIIDEKEQDSYFGRTQFDAPEVDGIVHVRSSRSLKPGDLIKVRVTDTLEYDLVGEEVA
ncbi:MAG: MiaB/RimO family radical SAM methylthiotransferase [Candidatus Omnitrophica bacterium]|nr:MiaB/RimO family radical SAM methylthiotransferase [Candidatus Omnitrophota bacterium]